MMKTEVPRFCNKKVFDPRNKDSTVLIWYFFDELIQSVSQSPTFFNKVDNEATFVTFVGLIKCA